MSDMVFLVMSIAASVVFAILAMGIAGFMAIWSLNTLFILGLEHSAVNYIAVNGLLVLTTVRVRA